MDTSTSVKDVCDNNLIKKILITIDGSDAAKHAAEYAAILAEKVGATLVLFTILPPPPALYSDVLGDKSEYCIDYEKDLVIFYEEALEKTKNLLREKHPGLVLTTLFKRGDPSNNIVDVSDSSDIDLIVIGNREYGGLSRLSLGSVSYYVVEQCKKPILVVKS